MKKNTISLTSRLTLAYSLFLNLECIKLHFLASRINAGFKLNHRLNVNKNGTKLNNRENNAFRVTSTKTGSSETTTITVKDIISSNLSYSQSNFSTNISSASFHYAVLTDRIDLRSKKFVIQNTTSKILTVKVEFQKAQNICKSQSDNQAFPAISQKVNINGL